MGWVDAKDRPARHVDDVLDWIYGWCYGAEWTSEELRGALRVLAEIKRITARKPGKGKRP